MAVALQNSAFSKTRPTSERRPLLQPVRLVVGVVLAALVALAVSSGAWLGLALVAALYLFGTALLTSGDEPLSVRQALSVGTVHLAAGVLLAL